ncbi:MAG: aldo/keto reductase [Candidatus Latescibacteria bacterium]|nr:aldo/keto reductase [Candidatus Latescibacterota bacterium]
MEEDSLKLTRRQLLQCLGSGLVLGGAGDGSALTAMIERVYEEVPTGRVDMGHRLLGKTDMKLSPVGLGGLLAHYEGVRGHPPPDEKRRIYLRAAELGITLFDMGYGDEVHIPEELKGNREDIHFSLKSGKGGGAPRVADLEGEVDKHLRNLNRDRIDILRLHHYVYVGNSRLAEKIAALKQAGKIRSVCLIRHYLQDQLVYAGRGSEPEADVDLVIYNYVSRWQEPGIAQAAQAGKGVLVMKALGGQQLSWEHKLQTDWTQVGEETVERLAVRNIKGEELKLVHSFVAGPWHELAEPGERVPRTDTAVKWVLKNQNVSSVLVAVASVDELEQVLGLGRPPTTAVRPATWGAVKALSK